jgi:hypothetical protein
VPQMDLFEPDAPRFSRISGVWTRIWTYMLWPDDEKQRNAYVISMLADAIAAIEKHADTDQDYALAGDIVYRKFCKLGGWTALVPRWRSNTDLKRAGQQQRTAAAVLDIIRKAPCGTGSLNKAVHVIERTGVTYNLICGRTDVLNAWKRYRTVAHLILGLLFLDKNVLAGVRDVWRDFSVSHATISGFLQPNCGKES